MKKFFALLLALVMCLSLAACGGTDASKAIEAFNSANTSLTEVGNMANENLDLVDQATVDALNKIANTFAGYKAELEGEDLTQDRADAIVSELAPYPAQIADLKAQVEALIAGGGETEDIAEPEAGGEENTELPGLMNYLVPAQLPEDLSGTGWAFAGGYIDGTEMEQADAENALAQYGGLLQIVFLDDTNVSMVQGGGELAGTYAPAGDGFTAEIVFDNNGSELKYAGIFSDVGGTAVLVLFSDATFMNAIYFTQITEG